MNPSTTAKHLTILTGASRGMGLAMAEQLLAPDRVLLCISRKTHDGLAQMASTQGASLTQWQQDLADTQGAAQRLQDWLTTQLPAGLASATLINNAGVSVSYSHIRAHEARRNGGVRGGGV
jgi:short-subunit dehydrogenase